MGVRVLKIDGNYFAMRALGMENMGDKINNLETKAEISNFKSCLNNSLINLVTAFQPFITNIIITHDNKSWRKEIEPHRPYYMSNDKKIGYKEQRVEVKEESSINYDNFYMIFTEWIESLKAKFIVFDIEGLEGDDILALISAKFEYHKDAEAICFCTDGDLMQIVRDNVMLMRNIRSKDAPQGEFVLSNNKYCEIFETSARQELLSPSSTREYKSLFAMSLFGSQSIKRTLHEGINIATPFKIALLKSICGDKKDNLFSILSWKASTGLREFKLTEKYVEKALALDKMFLTEATCKQLLMNPKLLENLMVRLKEVTKQKDVDIKTMGKHLYHNLRMNVLSQKNIPSKYVDKFEEVWQGYEDQIFDYIFDFDILKTLTVGVNDSAKNLLEKSLPTELDSIINQ